MPPIVNSYRTEPAPFPTPSPPPPPPPPSPSFSPAAEVAFLRAHPDFGASLRAGTDVLAPDGLQLPDAPNTTLTVTANSVAELIANLVNGRKVVMNPANSPYSIDSTITFPALTDFEWDWNGSTIIGPDLAETFTLMTPLGINQRIKIGNGILSGGIGTILGRDIHLKNIQATGKMIASPWTAAYSSTCSGFYGQRILVESCRVRNYANGFFFCGGFNSGRFQATISGNVMTVTSLSYGPLAVGMTIGHIFGATNVSIPPWTRIASFGSGTGGPGTYILTATCSWTGTGTFFGSQRSVNLLCMNSDVEVPDTPSGAAWAHENSSRFNGIHLAVIHKSRMFCKPKSTWRVHADYATGYPSGQVVIYGNQFEFGGVLTAEPGDSGIFPSSEAIWMYENDHYNDEVGMTPGIAYNSQLTIDALGDGTVALVNVNFDYIRHGFDAGEIVNVNGINNAAFTANGVAMTIVDSKQATYPCTALTGTRAYASWSVVRTGTGDGTLGPVTLTNQSVPPQNITITFTSATAFSVSGSVSGSLGTGTVGAAFTSSAVNFTVSAGGTAFVSGDNFTFKVGILARVQINRTKVLNPNFTAKNNRIFSVGLGNNIGWVPGGAGSPGAPWTTVADQATAYSYGNIRYNYSSTPAWNMQA